MHFAAQADLGCVSSGAVCVQSVMAETVAGPGRRALLSGQGMQMKTAHAKNKSQYYLDVFLRSLILESYDEYLISL